MKNKLSEILGFLTGFFLMAAITVFAGATFSRVTTWSSGDTLTASALNGEFQNIMNNLTPGGIDDYSTDSTEMRSVADPYPASTENLATSLEGELERLRYQILELKKAVQPSNVTYWYQDAPTAGVFTISGSSVGVNDTTPDYSFDVEGTAGISSNVTIGGNLTVTGDLSYTNTTSNFSSLMVAISSSTITQNFTTLGQIMFDDVIYDTLSEYDTNTSTFSATYAGKYLVTSKVFDSSDTVHGAALSIYVNGQRRDRVWCMLGDAGVVTDGSSCSITAVVDLGAGDYVSLYYQPSITTNLLSMGCVDGLSASCQTMVAITRLQ